MIAICRSVVERLQEAEQLLTAQDLPTLEHQALGRAVAGEVDDELIAGPELRGERFGDLGQVPGAGVAAAALREVVTSESHRGVLPRG